MSWGTCAKAVTARSIRARIASQNARDRKCFVITVSPFSEWRERCGVGDVQRGAPGVRVPSPTARERLAREQRRSGRADPAARLRAAPCPKRSGARTIQRRPARRREARWPKRSQPRAQSVILRVRGQRRAEGSVEPQTCGSPQIRQSRRVANASEPSDRTPRRSSSKFDRATARPPPSLTAGLPSQTVRPRPKVPHSPSIAEDLVVSWKRVGRRVNTVM